MENNLSYHHPLQDRVRYLLQLEYLRYIEYNIDIFVIANTNGGAYEN